MKALHHTSAYKIFIGKPERKRPHGRPRQRWEDNTGLDHGELGWEGVDWIQLAKDRDELQAAINKVMNL
jgi:hypothetical protein